MSRAHFRPMWDTYEGLSDLGVVDHTDDIRLLRDLKRDRMNYLKSGRAEVYKLKLQESKDGLELLQAYQDFYSTLRETEEKTSRERGKGMVSTLNVVIAERGDLAQTRSAINRPIVQESVAAYDLSKTGDDYVAGWEKFFGALGDSGTPLDARVHDQQMPQMVRTLVRRMGGVAWDPDKKENGGFTFGNAEAWSPDAVWKMKQIGEVAQQAEVAARQYDAWLYDRRDEAAAIADEEATSDEDADKLMAELNKRVLSDVRNVEKGDGVTGAEARYQRLQEGDEYLAENKILSDKLEEIIYGKSGEDKYVKAFSNPAFMKWADEHGFKNMGKVVDGVYLPGKDDYKALAAVYFENKRGYTKAGRPRYAIGTSQTTGEVIEVRYRVEPDSAEATERLRGSDGSFFAETSADGTTTYITEDEYKGARLPKLRVFEMPDLSGTPVKFLRDMDGRFRQLTLNEETGKFEISKKPMPGAAADGLIEAIKQQGIPSKALVVTNEQGEVTRFADADDISVVDGVSTLPVGITEMDEAAAYEDVGKVYTKTGQLPKSLVAAAYGARMPSHWNDPPDTIRVKTYYGSKLIYEKDIVDDGLVILETSEDAGLRDVLWMFSDRASGKRGEDLGWRRKNAGSRENLEAARTDPEPRTVPRNFFALIRGIQPEDMPEAGAGLGERALRGGAELPFEGEEVADTPVDKISDEMGAARAEMAEHEALIAEGGLSEEQVGRAQATIEAADAETEELGARLDEMRQSIEVEPIGPLSEEEAINAANKRKADQEALIAEGGLSEDQESEAQSVIKAADAEIADLEGQRAELERPAVEEAVIEPAPPVGEATTQTPVADVREAEPVEVEPINELIRVGKEQLGDPKLTPRMLKPPTRTRQLGDVSVPMGDFGEGTPKETPEEKAQRLRAAGRSYIGKKPGDLSVEEIQQIRDDWKREVDEEWAPSAEPTVALAPEALEAWRGMPAEVAKRAAARAEGRRLGIGADVTPSGPRLRGIRADEPEIWKAPAEGTPEFLKEEAALRASDKRRESERADIARKAAQHKAWSERMKSPWEAEEENAEEEARTDG